MILIEAMRGALQALLRPPHLEAPARRARDLPANGEQEPRQLLYVRLGGGVDQHRTPVAHGSAHQEVLGGGDRGVVQPVVGSLQPPGRAQHDAVAVARSDRPEQPEDLDVRIDLAHTERTALGIVCEHSLAEAVQKARNQQHRSAHAGRKPGRPGV